MTEWKRNGQRSTQKSEEKLYNYEDVIIEDEHKNVTNSAKHNL